MIITISTLSVVWVNGTGYYFFDSVYLKSPSQKAIAAKGASEIF
jgi:hypothetical protein